MRAKAWVISLFLVAVVGAMVFVVTRGDQTEEATDAQATPAASAPASDQASRARVAGQYVDYRDGIIEESQGQRVLFFHAPWCPQCRSIESGIKKEGVPDGFTVIKVDYDSNQELRKKYGVTIQTTFVKVDANGNRLDNYVAYDEPTFASVKQNFLTE